MLIGFVGQDPILKQIDGGKSICNLRVATTEQYTDKSGVKREITEWHDICCFDALAESVAKGTKKGRQLYIEGKIRSKTIANEDGTNRVYKDIIAQTVQFLGTLPKSTGDKVEVPE